jgi:lysophospholipase L1-like esterase
MKKLLLVLFLLFFPCLSYATIQIVVIGDSITTNHFTIDPYYSILERNLKSSYDVKVMSFGVGGMHSGGGFSILDGLYRSFDKEIFDPTIAVLAIGINDFGSAIKWTDTYKCIEFFIQLSLKNGCIPVIGKIDLTYLYPGVPIDRIMNFNNIFDNLSKKYNIPLFDFLTPEIMNNPNNHMGDRTHPNANGHKIIESNLEYVILNLLNNK